MNITLTPDIEQVLSQVAKKQGATVESIILKTLRECFFQKESKKTERSEMNNLADMLKEDIGTIDSGEISGRCSDVRQYRKKICGYPCGKTPAGKNMILTDTGPLIALLDKRDNHHKRCIDAVKTLPAESMLTTWPCFTEAMHILGAVGGYRYQAVLWRLVQEVKLELHDPTAEKAQGL